MAAAVSERRSSFTDPEKVAPRTPLVIFALWRRCSMETVRESLQFLLPGCKAKWRMYREGKGKH